jgi:hypothetical protein
MNIPKQKQVIQTADLLEEIATIVNGAGNMLNNCDPEGPDHAKLLLLARVLDQAGWMAELGICKLTGSEPGIVGGAEAWMLSPVFNSQT